MTERPLIFACFWPSSGEGIEDCDIVVPRIYLRHLQVLKIGQYFSPQNCDLGLPKNVPL